MSRLQPLQTSSLPQQIAELIYIAAARGQFLPDEKLIEADLAQELGVSRIPVREALRLLESRGLVVSEPYKGMRLMAVSTQDCRERFRIYRALALEALDSIASQPPDPELWRASRSLVEAAEAAGQTGDKGAALQAIAAFFDCFFMAARNEALSRIIRDLNTQFAIYGSLFSNRRSLLEQRFLDQVLDHVTSRDFKAAEEALKRYLDPAQVGDVESALRAAWKRREEQGAAPRLALRDVRA